MTTQAKAGKPAKKPKKTAAKAKAKDCEAPRPTRTGITIGGPANSPLYSEAIADEICRRLRDGELLKSICRTKGLPSKATVLTWANDTSHPFSDRYARAREIGYAHLAEEILEISDNSEGDFIERPGKDGEMTKVVDHEAIARARLRVNSRKWMLSKMLPRVYGDRLVTELTGKDGGPVEIQASSSAIRERIAERLNRITLAAATAEREANGVVIEGD